MPERSKQLSISRIMNEDLTDSHLQDIVKELEAKVYGYDYPFLIDPEYPEDCLYEMFANNCGTFTSELVDLLQERSIRVIEATSNETRSDSHIYCMLYTKQGVRILDSSIGSIIKGVRGVVISSRSELKNRIEDPNTILFCSAENRADLFLRWWGRTSRTLGGLEIPEQT